MSQSLLRSPIITVELDDAKRFQQGFELHRGSAFYFCFDLLPLAQLHDI
jgi:hypothetical protein